MKASCTDQEFIDIWNELGSPTLVASRLNISVRNAQARRRSIEIRYNIILSVTNSQREGDISTYRITHKARVNLTLENGVVIVFSDAHFWPGFTSAAYRALLFFIHELKPLAVVCNGDAFDGSTISRFPRIGWDSKPSVAEELKVVSDSLLAIEGAAKGAKLVWTLGNHDARYETFLASRAPEYQGVKGFSLKDHYPRWIPAWTCWVNSDTVIKHRYRGGIHATHNNTLNGGVNFITGHLHSLKVTPFTDYNGTRFGVDTGTLADPNGPQFLDYTEDNPKNHRSGFVVLSLYEGLLLWPEIVNVLDEDEGLVQFRGKVIKV